MRKLEHATLTCLSVRITSRRMRKLEHTTLTCLRAIIGTRTPLIHGRMCKKNASGANNASHTPDDGVLHRRGFLFHGRFASGWLDQRRHGPCQRKELRIATPTGQTVRNPSRVVSASTYGKALPRIATSTGQTVRNSTLCTKARRISFQGCARAMLS